MNIKEAYQDWHWADVYVAIDDTANVFHKLYVENV
jgi:hypothetical protein